MNKSKDIDIYLTSRNPLVSFAKFCFSIHNNNYFDLGILIGQASILESTSNVSPNGVVRVFVERPPPPTKTLTTPLGSMLFLYVVA